jgi:hypothetical protein
MKTKKRPQPRPEVDAREIAIRARSDRWSCATIAAALSYPTDFRADVEEWSDLMDDLEEGITGAELRSSSRVAVARWNRNVIALR